MPKKVVIVGGVAGGASCAARLRRLDETAEVVMLERGPYISFANCGLPYYIGGVIEERDELLLQTPESFNRRFGVDVRVNSEVTGIDRDTKTVSVKSAGKEYTEGYDVLVLSPGSSPIVPEIPGVQLDKVMPLWTIPDMDRISAAIEEDGAKSAVVVGGGFIGIEMAENLRHAGLDVTLIDMMDQVMPSIDFDMAQLLHRHLTEKGVKLALADAVRRFDETDGGVTVVTDKLSLQADIVILSIGVKPNVQLAKGCGLEIGQSGGIVVDESLRTQDESIYAVGDAVEVTHYVSGLKAMIPLAGPANKMGRMAADNIAGQARVYKGSLGSSVAKVFDLTVASTGLSEKELREADKKLGVDFKTVTLHPLDHAGYYPGGRTLCIKLVFGTDGKVLGAQAVGQRGATKRIDVIATAIKFGASIYDLEELDLCYAPPYSSAKDPVNMAGFAAENVLRGVVDNITVAQLQGLGEDTVLLDVRTQREVAMGTIDGSVHVPVDSLRENIESLDKDKDYVVFCAVGIRAHIASRILKQSGFERVRNLAGGFTSYKLYTQDFNMKSEQYAAKIAAALR